MRSRAVTIPCSCLVHCIERQIAANRGSRQSGPRPGSTSRPRPGPLQRGGEAGHEGTGIPRDDRLASARPRLAAIRRPNKVHFPPEGSEILAGEVRKAHRAGTLPQAVPDRLEEYRRHGLRDLQPAVRSDPRGPARRHPRGAGQSIVSGPPRPGQRRRTDPRALSSSSALRARESGVSEKSAVRFMRASHYSLFDRSWRRGILKKHRTPRSTTSLTRSTPPTPNRQGAVT